MSTTENRMPLTKAKAIADRFIKYLKPYCSVISVAGSVRRECETCGDIEVVIVPKDEFAMGQAFPMGYPGLTINGARLKKFYYPEMELHMELYITNISDYGRILAIRTGSSFYSHTALAMQWNRRGFCGTEDGLRHKSECIKKSTWKIKPEYKGNPTLPPIFDTEEKFFEFIGAKWIPPKDRSWIDQRGGQYNYKL
jgi:DNA polymerase/3'-5' exonuclease PolX